MNFDWFLLLTPVLLAVIVLPFVFVGCGVLTADSGGGRTTLKLQFDPLLQVNRYSAAHHKTVTKVTVTWTLLQKGTAMTRPMPPQDIVSTEIPPSVPPEIRPQITPGLDTPLDDSDPSIGSTWNAVRCECAITMEDGTVVPPPPPATMDLVSLQVSAFWLRPVPEPIDRWGPPPYPFVIVPDVT